MGKTFLEPTLGGNFQDIMDRLRRIEDGLRNGPIATVSALPPNPTHGQIIVFQTLDMAVLGVRWQFQYNANAVVDNIGTPSPYKWEYVGGARIITPSISRTGVTATNYAAASGNSGNQIILPLAGEYESLMTARMYSSSNTSGSGPQMGMGDGTSQIGGQIDSYQGSAGSSVTLFAAGQAKQNKFTRTAAQMPTTLDMRLWTNAGTVQADTAEMSLAPIRVG